METQPAVRDRPSPQAAKSAAMRAAILQTAVARLAAGGYHATSIKKIAADGGFSIGAVQHHFPTKTRLMAAVVERALERAERYVARWVERDRGRSGLSGLVADSWGEQINSPWYLAMLEVLVAARTDTDLRRAIAPAIRTYFCESEARIAALVERGLDPGRVHFLLTVSRCMLGGFLVQDALAMPPAQIAGFVRRWGAFLDEELEAPRHG